MPTIGIARTVRDTKSVKNMRYYEDTSGIPMKNENRVFEDGTILQKKNAN